MRVTTSADRPKVTPSAVHSRKAALVLLALLSLVWGVHWVVVKEGLRYFPPLTYAARGWEDACLLGRRSAQSALTQVLCEFWLAASDDVFAVTTDDFERLTQRRPRSFESFVRQHRGQFRAVSAA